MNYIGTRWRSKTDDTTTVVICKSPKRMGQRHYRAETLETGRLRNISIDTLHSGYEKIRQTTTRRK